MTTLLTQIEVSSYMRFHFKNDFEDVLLMCNLSKEIEWNLKIKFSMRRHGSLKRFPCFFCVLGLVTRIPFSLSCLTDNP